MSKIKVEVSVAAPISKVWEYWVTPEHIQNWNFASDDWHCPEALNDLRVDGSFSYTMAAKEGRMSFDFVGFYSEIKPNELISYFLEDDREVDITFKSDGDNTIVTQLFDAESENPIEAQQAGWQSIMENFKKCVEGTM